MSGDNGNGDVVEATVVDEVPAGPDMGALVPTGGVALAVTPQVKAEELVERLEVIKQAADKAMKEDVDFGKVPGTDKPTLLKPGAEKLSVLFQLDIQLANEKRWEENGHLTVISKATAFHAPTGARLGFGEGICTTRERKYGKRTAKPKCPTCNEETVFRSKRDPEFYCWAKKGGCGTTFKLDDERITKQEVGEIDNPDLPDLWNTAVKMAEKRARVDVVLAVTGASALFTQDVEDSNGSGPGAPSEEEPPVSPFPEPAADAPRIDVGRVEAIGAKIGTLGLSYRRIGALLSSCQINGLRAGSGKALRERVESLTPEQADALEAALEREAQDQGAEDGARDV